MSDELPTWYTDWSGDYTAVFALNPEAFADVARAWYPVFAMLGASGDLMAKATREVQVSDSPPKFLGDHMPAVKAALGRVKDRERKRETPVSLQQGESYSVCNFCANTGLVSVPHPAHVTAGEWGPWKHNADGMPIYATAVVSCRCHRGVRQRDSTAERSKPILTLEQYEATVNPAWREHLIEREQQAQWAVDAERRAVVTTEGIAKAFAMPGGNYATR